MEKEYKQACSVCETSRKPVHCPDCLNGPLLGEKRIQLQQLQQRSQALLDQLTPQLALRVRPQLRHLNSFM